MAEGWKPGKFLKQGIEKIKGDAPSAPTDAPDVPSAVQASAPEEDFADCERESGELRVEGSGGSLPRAQSLSARPAIFNASEPIYLNIVVVDASQVVWVTSPHVASLRDIF